MLPTVFDEAKELQSLNGKPLAVLTAGSGSQRGWTAAQNNLAQLSTDSIHRTARGATHAELLEDRRSATITTRSSGTSSRPPDDLAAGASAARSEVGEDQLLQGRGAPPGAPRLPKP